MGFRVFGFIIGGVFSVCGALIGYGFTDLYLHLPFFRELAPDRYHTESSLALILLGGLTGFLIGSVLYRRFAEIGRNLKDIPAEDKVAWIVGTLVSLLPSLMLATVILSLGMPSTASFALILLLTVLVIWAGNAIALSMKDQLKYLVRGPESGPGARDSDTLAPPGVTFKLLDASAVIDGRIYDILRCGFLSGQVLVPNFVVKELQHLAAAPEPLRRNRGRRGLDVLQKMQNELYPPPEIFDRCKATFAPGEAIYTKLVKLAKEIGTADLVTCDVNLAKIARPYGVQVLNVNELASALKPALLPGEELLVTVVRDGKEANEGVGYLDDGSMVVIRDGRKRMGEQVAVGVVSVTHTVAGKMIFTDLREESHPALSASATKPG